MSGKDRNHFWKNGLKAWAGGAVLLLLFLTPLINHKSFQIQGAPTFLSASGQRSLASVDKSWELKLSEEAALKFKDELIGGDVHGPAGLGRRPSSYDRLAFGLLEGKYQFQLSQGKIHEIGLVDPGALGARLAEPEVLLSEFKSLFAVPYQKLAQRSQFSDQNQSVTVFDLLSEDDKRIGQASLIQNEGGGLQRLTIKALPAGSF